MKKKAVIIGSEGYLGQNLYQYLNARGYTVYCYDIVEVPSNVATNYTQIDIRDKESLKKIQYTSDIIFMLAAKTGTVDGFTDYNEYYEINVIGLVNLLSCYQESHSTARIVYPSTRLIFAGKRDAFLSEDSPKEVKTIYALTKLDAEYILKMYSTMYNINYTIFRICVPFGDVSNGGYSYGLIGLFLKQLAGGGEIILYGDGSQMRTFSHIEDIFCAILRTLSHESSNLQVYNIGGRAYSILSVAEHICSIYNGTIKHVEWPDVDSLIESGDTVFDSSKIEGLIGMIDYREIKVQ